jgi:AcrR family transcriptional regulator
MRRLLRVEQVQRNRAAVLDAACQVFVARGYGGASLEAIADEAGFSRGVVYSQFGSKADMFFALLDRRIEERGQVNALKRKTSVARRG